MINNIKNITCLLFILLLGLILGSYWGFLFGMEHINDRLIMAVAHENWKQGQIYGSTRTMYLIFEEWVNTNPYKVHGYQLGDDIKDVPKHELKNWEE